MEELKRRPKLARWQAARVRSRNNFQKPAHRSSLENCFVRRAEQRAPLQPASMQREPVLQFFHSGAGFSGGESKAKANSTPGGLPLVGLRFHAKRMHITEVSEVLGRAVAQLAAGQIAEATQTLNTAHVAARAQETAWEIWLEETQQARA
jgi:hypothetical protein